MGMGVHHTTIKRALTLRFQGRTSRAHVGMGCEMLAVVLGPIAGSKSVSSASTGATAPWFTTVSTFSSAGHPTPHTQHSGFVLEAFSLSKIHSQCDDCLS